jgi:hypothetical protein
MHSTVSLFGSITTTVRGHGWAAPQPSATAGAEVIAHLVLQNLPRPDTIAPLEAASARVSRS